MRQSIQSRDRELILPREIISRNELCSNRVSLKILTFLPKFQKYLNIPKIFFDVIQFLGSNLKVGKLFLFSFRWNNLRQGSYAQKDKILGFLFYSLAERMYVSYSFSFSSVTFSKRKGKIYKNTVFENFWRFIVFYKIILKKNI